MKACENCWDESLNSIQCAGQRADFHVSSFVLYYLSNEKPGFCNNYDCYSGNWLEIKGHLENQSKTKKKSASKREDRDENIKH